MVTFSFSRFACARESQLAARASSPRKARPAIPSAPVSIQLWFCRYSSNHHAVGIAAAILCASTPILLATVARSASDSVS